jgi:hypothetical protein
MNEQINERQQRILIAIAELDDGQGVHYIELCKVLGLFVGIVAYELADLEIKNLVVSVDTERYSLPGPTERENEL